MSDSIRHITLETLQMWQDEGKLFQLVDVREPEEHAAFNIGGTLIPLSEVLKQQAQLDCNSPIVVYCKRGIRSQLAIQRLSAVLPTAELYNLQGGIIQYQKKRD